MKTLRVEPKMICRKCGYEYLFDEYAELFNHQCGCGAHDDFYRKWEILEDDGAEFSDDCNTGEISEEYLGTLNIHDNIILEDFEIILLDENGEMYMSIVDGNLSDPNFIIELK